jgi:5-methyltetrahydropteroyltriglutamate--homocysteine methyltransferase
LRRRITEASQYVPLERIGVSPQCGFASSIIGNNISPQDQIRKLALVVETAQRVWG